MFRKANYPSYLVLEMGADHPGDISYLVSFIPVQIGVLTKVSPVHIAYFKSLSSIFKEKKEIFKNIPAQGWAVLNNDDQRIKTLNDKLNCQVISYGIDQVADVQATDLQLVNKAGIIGMNFKIRYQGHVVPVFLPHSLGISQVYSFLGGTAVALISGFNLVEISSGASHYQAPKGRTKLIPGIKKTQLIDDSYNSSPAAVKLSLNLLSKMKNLNGGRTIAVLGDMLELGAKAADLHQQIGKYAAGKGIDLLFTVGELSQHTFQGAQSKLEHSFHFNNQAELIAQLQSIIQADDNVLIKGSQGARMEKVVKALMAQPEQAADLLVRQSPEWLNR